MPMLPLAIAWAEKASVKPSAWKEALLLGSAWALISAWMSNAPLTSTTFSLVVGTTSTPVV